ncbi:hypothetical protein CYY_007312 [Polysphondylium violaceum]|uniref:UbiA prenyltransferase family protein n=1 Tax=Polysphondylium violaceum TaxID=133409 RepID=A0A8J4V2B8_9MYCE|nr:hypothetical protein CYY_007312 [Polysphondylium violaceum]
MLSFKQLKGIYFGFRAQCSIGTLSTLLIGILFGYKETGIINPYTPVILFMAFKIYTIMVLLNSLYDMEAGVDKKETANDRTMFDFDLTRKDIFAYVYRSLLLLFVLFIISFNHFNLFQQCFSFFCFLLLIASCFLYNTPPFRFKEKLFMAEIMMLYYGIMPFIGYFWSTGEISYKSLLFGLPTFFLCIMSMLTNLLIDIDEDKQGGVYSTPMLIGERATINLITFSYLLYVKFNCFIVFKIFS